jgi:hypothetical protein
VVLAAFGTVEGRDNVVIVRMLAAAQGRRGAARAVCATL